jgi:hypothetical protein
MRTIGLTRPFLLLLAFSHLSGYSIAQSELPPFGTVNLSEFDIKECSFDKTADAVVIYDQAISNYNDEYNLVTRRRTRFKILKESGIEHGNIHIRFYSKDKFEFITGINAVVINPRDNSNFNTVSLDRKTIFTRKLNELQSEVVFALPNIKVGSIIEYEYESVKQHYGGLDDWYFQKDIPVTLSSYMLYILPNTSFNYVVHKADFMNISVQPNGEAGSVVFEMKNVPGLRDEAYSTSYKKYLQRVRFQLASITQRGTVTKYSNNWKELNRDFLDSRNFGAQINKKLSSPAVAMLTSYSEPYKKMQSIHNYVRKNFQWTNVYSLYAEETLKTIADRKKGNAADLNLLLVNYLKDAGFDAYPLLVSERWHGSVDTTISFQDQFNKVVTLVYLDGKKYILDATDPYTPSNMIPSDLLNTIGFVVDKKDFGFLQLKDVDKRKLYTIELLGKIDKSGLVKGTASVDFYDYARIGKAEQYNNNKQKYKEQFAATGLKIDSFTVDGLELDSVKLHHNFSIEYGLGKSGSYSLLNYNFFTGFDKNPFVSDYRFTDIDFGAKSYYLLHGVFELPEELKIDALPKNITLRTPDQALQIIREIRQKDNKTVEVSIRLEFNNTQYAATDYPIIKDFFGKMIDLLNEPFVLKAK